MKVKELKLMNDQDLQNKIYELKNELMKINSQIATRTVPKNPSKVKEIKRTIAKILTIQNVKSTNKFLSVKQQSKVLRQQKGGSTNE